jgi:hypothetical protein
MMDMTVATKFAFNSALLDSWMEEAIWGGYAT